MAKKSNIRSMRFSDDVIEMIESQQGENFSQKFENLVTRCMWELPAKERELRRVDQQIDKQLHELQRLKMKISRYQEKLRTFDQLFDRLDLTFDELSRSYQL